MAIARRQAIATDGAREGRWGAAAAAAAQSLAESPGLDLDEREWGRFIDGLHKAIVRTLVFSCETGCDRKA